MKQKAGSAKAHQVALMLEEWLRSRPKIAMALQKLDVDGSVAVAGFLLEMAKDDDWVKQFKADQLAEAGELSEPSIATAAIDQEFAQLMRTCRRVYQAPPTLAEVLVETTRTQKRHSQDISSGNFATNKRPWHKWKLKHVTAICDDEKVQEQEQKLKLEWSNRFIAHFKPFHESLPSFKMVWGSVNRDAELWDLCGSARWTSIRKHTLTLEGYLRDKIQQGHEDTVPFIVQGVLSHLSFLERDCSSKGSRIRATCSTARARRRDFVSNLIKPAKPCDLQHVYITIATI